MLARLHQPLLAVLILCAVFTLPACTAAHSVDNFRLQGQIRNGLPTRGVVLLHGDSFPSLGEDERARAQRAETERVLTEVWAVAGSADAPGAQWAFRYWSQGGPLTLLSFHRLEAGEGTAAPIGRSAFLSGLDRNLPLMLGTSARAVTFLLEREETGWEVDLETSTRDEPPLQARSLPSLRAGTTEAGYSGMLAVARGMQGLMKVPRGGSARVEVRIALEDDRVTGWETAEWDTSGNGPDIPASEAEVALITHALRPFLHGLGGRTVALTLEGLHREGERRPRWSVVEAWTVEPPPLPRELEDFGREYLALRERILLESQEGMREGAIFLAGFSLEQVATMLIGGFVLKHALVIFEAVAPTVTSFLVRGGRGAVHWLRNLLVRMPATERKALQQPWLKAETQGLKALTEAEKTELKTLMGRLEGLLKTSLDERAKDKFRTWARAEYFELHRPDFAKILGKVRLQSYDVHHACPLEYAHLFPKLDINGGANLVGVYKDVHKSIGKVWSSVRPSAEKLSPRDVRRVMDIVQRHYGRWFHSVYDASSAPALARAEGAALAEAAEVIAALAR